MATSVAFRYPLDPTGIDPNNAVVGEVKTLVSSAIRAVVPTYGPFFTESLIIYDNISGRLLIRGVDYKIVEMLQEATLKFGKEIAQMAIIINTAVSNEIRINYQVLGGLFQNSAEGIANLYNALTIDSRGVDWSDVLNKPTAFPPTLHRHFLDDIYGFEPVVVALERVRNAIVLSDVPAFEEIINFIRNYFVTSVDYSNNANLTKYVTGELLKAELSRLGAGNATTAQSLSAHLADVDPHPQYLLQTEGDARYVQLTALVESAQDAVAQAITSLAGDGISVTYDDVANQIRVVNTDKGTTAVTAHTAATDPHPQYTTNAEATTIANSSAATAVSTHTAAADPHPQYATDADLQALQASLATASGNASTALAAHISAADPHTQYLKESESIGGANLIANPSFEIADPETGFTAAVGLYCNTGTFTSSRIAGRNGKGIAVRITATDISTAATSFAFGFHLPMVENWRPNTSYIVSFWARKINVNGAVSTLGNAGMRLNWNDAPASTTVIQSNPLTSEFQRYVFKITWGNTVERAHLLYMTAINTPGVAVGDSIDIDDVTVQEGAWPTHYQQTENDPFYEKTFLAISSGFSSPNREFGLFDAVTTGRLDGGRTTSRSYLVVLIDKISKNIVQTTEYDVSGAGATTSGRDAAALAAYLNALDDRYVVVITTGDEPQSNRLTAGLPAAMYRCGASPAVFGSTTFRYRSAYILVGVPGCGEGNGHEAYRGDVDSDPNAYVKMSFFIRNTSVYASVSNTKTDLASQPYVDATLAAAINNHINSIDPHSRYNPTWTSISATAGYVSFSNGLKIQYTRASLSGGQGLTLSFPVSFSSICFAVLIGKDTHNPGATRANWAAYPLSLSTFFVGTADAATYWIIAIGI